MSPAIQVENLGKRYRLGNTHSGSIRELVSGAASHLFGRRPELLPHEAAKAKANGQGDFWALKDVSFEVQPGEVVGIIGKNGAGKSTLLKILSNIVSPTTGSVGIRGRVASLLEVGTGFHPELTGRENVYLNGAILGMTKAEIRRKFDDIVAFAEIEEFIDTPVKRYSSGMYVRLAFAVAAHLEPEILIIDEVLAVGDFAFQKKCLDKMGEVSERGRTVLFVSHSMAAVTSLCDRCILLRAGLVEQDGEVNEVAEHYLRSAMQTSMHGKVELRAATRSMGDQTVRFTRMVLRNSVNEITTTFRLGEPIRIGLELESDISHSAGEVGFSVRTLSDVVLFTSSSTDHNPPLEVRPGAFQLEVVLDPNYLRPGSYWMQVGTTCGTVRDVIPEAIQFTIDNSWHYSDSPLLKLPGHLYFQFTWTEPKWGSVDKRPILRMEKS